ncbi:hypothetical protein HBB16_18610 [Pseudonocardia sp. MCCB 268]|nr:hypothetical protein [Pseudonocardia cytotoxica]
MPEPFSGPAQRRHPSSTRTSQALRPVPLRGGVLPAVHRAARRRPASPVIIARPDQRLLVLEDLGRSMTLADKLFGPDREAARTCLLGWARGLEPDAGGDRRAACGSDCCAASARRSPGPSADQAAPRSPGSRTCSPTPSASHVPARRCWRRTAAAGSPAAQRDRVPGVQPVRHLPGQQPGHQPRESGSSTSSGAASGTSCWTPPTSILNSPPAPASFALPAPVATDARRLAGRGRSVARARRPGVLESRLGDAHLLWVWWSTWLLLPRLLRRDGDRRRRRPVPADLHRAAALLARAGRGRSGLNDRRPRT